MPSSIIKRLIAGFSANVYGQIVTVCTQILGVPILLYYWGIQVYGEWLMLNAIPIYLYIADLGMAQSSGNDMSQRMARGDTYGALTVFQSTGLLILLTSLSGLVLVGILLTGTSLVGLLPIHNISHQEAAWVIGLLSAEALVHTNEGTIHAGFRASGGYAVHTALYCTSQLIQNIMLWIFAANGGGVLSGAAAFLMVRLIATPTAALILVRKYKWIDIRTSHASWKHLRGLFRPALANIVLPLSNTLNIQGIRLAIGSALGPIALVTFSTIRTLTRLILQASTTVGHAAEPEFAAAYGNREFILLRKLYLHGIQLTIVLALVLSIALCFTSHWILEVLTHGKVIMDAILFGALLISAITAALWHAGLVVLKGTNRHLRSTIFYLSASGLAVLAAFGILSSFGRLSDAAIIIIIMDLAIAAFVIPAAWRFMGINWRQFIKGIIRPF